MRQARPSDSPSITALLRQAAATGFATASADEIDEADVVRDLEEGLGLRIVAERQGEVVGYLKVEVGENVSLARTGRLQFVVRRDLQGKGIGAELLRSAAGWAEAGAVDRLEVFVRAGNERALALYRRFGFVEEGRLRQRFRAPDGGLLDDLVLGRVFERPVG
jgi:ribosomal protein S18 acetylase RimI-like enzyme